MIEKKKKLDKKMNANFVSILINKYFFYNFNPFNNKIRDLTKIVASN